MKWFVYILKCRDGALYTGIARDVEKRLARHNAKKGSKAIRGRLPAEVIYTQGLRTKGLALKREAQIKSWTRARKLAFIRSAGVK